MDIIKLFAFSDEASPSLSGQISALKRNNLDGMEIRGIDGENIADITPAKAREIKCALESEGLYVWSIGSPIGKIGITDAFLPHLEKFKRLLEITDILSAKSIRLFSFYINSKENADIYKDEVMLRLSRFTEAVHGGGITLCHENEKGIYGDIPERCLEIHKALPEIRAVFDPANFIQCGVDTLSAYSTLKEYIHYMHIKDCKSDGSVVPAGMGIGNIKEITSDLISSGKTVFTIEPHLTVFDGLKSLERKGEETKQGLLFNSADEAFLAACNSFKDILKEKQEWK